MMKTKDKVIWKNWNCIVSKVKDGIFKIKPDYKSGNTIPFDYYWVDKTELR